MEQEHAERAVKALQKSFLYWMEDAPALRNVGAHLFNRMRKEVFSTTFQAFRLGVVGVDPNAEEEIEEVWDLFRGPSMFFDNNLGHDSAYAEELWEVEAKYVAVLLVCYRLGAAVAFGRKHAV